MRVRFGEALRERIGDFFGEVLRLLRVRFGEDLRADLRIPLSLAMCLLAASVPLTRWAGLDLRPALVFGEVLRAARLGDDFLAVVRRRRLGEARAVGESNLTILFIQI